MAKSILLISSLFTLLLAGGCQKEPCLNVVRLDSLRTEMLTWYVSDTRRFFLVEDSYGIEQTLQATELRPHHTDKVVEDDCGNTYGSDSFQAYYTTSVSPLHFSVSLHGSGWDETFYLSVEASRISDTGPLRKKTEYDLVARKGRDKNASFEYMDSLRVSDNWYKDVLAITFADVKEAQQVEKMYYAKKYGLVRFATKNGNVFSRN